MNFGPQWIRTLTDAGGASGSSGTLINTANSPLTQSASAANNISANHNQQQLQQQSAPANNTQANNKLITSPSTANQASGLAINASPSSNANISHANSQQTLSAQTNNIANNIGTNNTTLNNSSNQCTKVYKLAEFRYGREEMLALFDQANEAPDDIKSFADLYFAETRLPLSLTQMTEEESKLTARNWNSEVVLRSSGKVATTATGAPATTGTGNPIPNAALASNTTLVGGAAVPGDRQVSADRTGSGVVNPTGQLSSSPRGPPGSLSRVPLEQRGVLASTNSRGAVPPRGGGGGPRVQSYTRSQYDEENDQGSADRRSVFERLPNKYASVDDKTVRKDANGRPNQSSDWRSKEWATAEGRSTTKFAPEDRSWRNRGATDDWRGGSSNQTANWYVKSDDRTVRGAGQESIGLGVKRDTVRRPSGGEKLIDGEDHDTHPRHRRDSIPEWSVSDPLSGDKVGSFDASGAFREDMREGGSDMRQQSSAAQQQQQQQQLHHRNSQSSESNPINVAQAAEDDGFAHLERAAEIMVAEWTAEEDHIESTNVPTSGFNMVDNQARKQHEAQVKLVQSNHAQAQQQLQQHQQQQQQRKQQQALEQVSNADANNQKKIILLPLNHEDSQQWFYRDTQGVIQGPFNAAEMFEWYKAGYFVKELLVRRACDELFYPLGNVVKLWDRIPFAPIPVDAPLPPPITAQTLLQLRAVKQLELVAGLNQSQPQIPPNAFRLSHPAAAVLLHGPMQGPPSQLSSAVTSQEQQQQQQAGIRQILRTQQQHDQNLAQRRVQQQQQQQQQQQNSMLDQSEMQTQLRQLLAQLKDRDGFSSLNAQEQQELLVRQYVASNVSHARIEEQQQTLQRLRKQQMLLNGNRFGQIGGVNQEDLLRLQQRELQQRIELERQQEAVEKQQQQQQQERLLLEHRLRAEEEKKRIIDEHQKRQHEKQKEQENEKQRRELEAEKERQRLSQLKQQQLAKQQEEFRQQMQTQQQRIQQQQEEKKLAQQQAAERAKKANLTVSGQQQVQQQQQQQQLQQQQAQAQQQQLQQEQQKKTAWSNVGKPDQEPVSLATLQRLQEEEKERERQRKLQQQMQSNHQQIQQQLQRQMTWASAAQQVRAPAPIKTLAEIQKEEEDRVARDKQKEIKVPAVVPNAGVWNNAASHLSWKNPSGNQQQQQQQATNLSTPASSNSSTSGAGAAQSLVSGKAGKKNKANNNANNALQIQF